MSKKAIAEALAIGTSLQIVEDLQVVRGDDDKINLPATQAALHSIRMRCNAVLPLIEEANDACEETK